MSSTLTKKQQKAQAFRTKQKTKKRGLEAPEDVPEHDLEDEEEVTIDPSSSSSGKKRKREAAAEGGPKLELDGKERKSIGKGKSKSDWDEGEEGEGEDTKKKSKKEVKQRFILFVENEKLMKGNMSYKTTQAEIQRHFKEVLDYVPSIRLLTTKATPIKPSKSRGIAFLEVKSSTDMQACLKLHHTSLGGRRINVELTAGGGGKSEARREKIAGRNERVGGQRERRAEKEKEEAGEQGQQGDAREPHHASGGGAEASKSNGNEVQEGANGKVRIRGGRRVKVKTNEAPPKANGALSGWSKRAATSAPPPRSGGGRRRFEPTGANAVSVG